MPGLGEVLLLQVCCGMKQEKWYCLSQIDREKNDVLWYQCGWSDSLEEAHNYNINKKWGVVYVGKGGMSCLRRQQLDKVKLYKWPHGRVQYINISRSHNRWFWNYTMFAFTWIPCSATQIKRSFVSHYTQLKCQVNVNVSLFKEIHSYNYVSSLRMVL